MNTKSARGKVNQSLKYMILAFFVTGIISLTATLFMDDIRRTLKNEVEIKVFSNYQSCETSIAQSLRHICKKKSETSKKIAESIFWPYRNKEECQLDFGVCEEINRSYWKPVQLAFGIVGTSSEYNPIPIFFSTTKGKFLSASGYPFIIGDNYVGDFDKNMEMMFTLAGKFDSTLCFKLSSGGTKCTNKNELLDETNEENLVLLQYSFAATRKN